MKKTLLSFVAVASITVAMNGQQASAQEVTVNKGDTLWGLSQKYETTVDNIKKLNNLSSDLIIANSKLVVTPEAEKKATTSYQVKKGDTLWKIANKAGVSVQNLQNWNQLKSTTIYPGQSLKMSGTNQATVAAQPTVNNTVETKTETKSTTTTTTKSTTSVAAPANATKSIKVSATAYTASCEGCSGVTATGVDLKANPNAKVIAVDPSVIPLGSKVYVEGYGYATAADTGGAIKGNKIDVFVPSQQGALNWGVKTVNVKVLN